MKAIILIITPALAFGCHGTENQRMQIDGGIDFYTPKLLDESFNWEGPTSNEDRIPALQAARALAYIGDPAVPALLEAVSDPRIDIISLEDALSEIGLPASSFARDLQRRDASGLKEWWRVNESRTRKERSLHRVRIGLPPL